MKYLILGATLAVLILLAPSVAAALLGAAGALAVTAAANPALLAFALGVAARPHITRRRTA